MMILPIAILLGDPSGIGPELIAKLIEPSRLLDSLPILLLLEREVF